MGYTQYWRPAPELDQDKFNKLVELTRKMLVVSTIPVAHDHDEQDREPQLDSDNIRFNGIGEDGHETFWIERKANGFNFCKTAQKPYDLLCVAILEMAHTIFGEDFTYSSDGEDEELQEGRDLARKLMNDEEKKEEKEKAD